MTSICQSKSFVHFLEGRQIDLIYNSHKHLDACIIYGYPIQSHYSFIYFYIKHVLLKMPASNSINSSQAEDVFASLSENFEVRHLGCHYRMKQ